jgi:malonyl-CoA/methylmalonyl-CoA synthetase
LIITGGLNVYPREVEIAAESFAGIKDVAVFSTPSKRWGEEVVIGVVADPGAVDTDHLLAHLRGMLAAYKVPKRVMFLDAIPRNHMGKVQRNELTMLSTGTSPVTD